MTVKHAVSSFLLPEVMRRVDEWRARDLQAVKRRRGCLHASVMLLCLSVLLGVIYYSQEPYRYSVSSTAFRSSMHITSLEEGDLDTSEVWEWFDDLLDDLGGESSKSVKLNCAYDDKKSQPVIIDGVKYYLVDPALDETACRSVGYIDGADDKVHLAGVHQVLSFGAFTTRARREAPRKGSVIAEQQKSITVAETDVSGLNPLADERVVSLCHLSEISGGSSFNGDYCIAEDASRKSAGSTFGWTGSISRF
jgi:hypothetical protein